MQTAFWISTVSGGTLAIALLSQPDFLANAKEAKVTALIKEYNRLFKAHQFLEAGKVAKEAFQLDPENPVTMSMLELWKMGRMGPGSTKTRDDDFDNKSMTRELELVQPKKDRKEAEKHR